MAACALSTMLCLATAQAQTARQVRETAESTLLVTGKIEISPQGHVDAYTLDAPDKLQPEVVQLLGKVIPQWTFEPTERDGVPVAVRSNMNVRLIARKVGEAYEMSLRSAKFSGDPQPGETVSRAKLTPPSYPQLAAKMHATGNVYVLVQVGRDGKVIHVGAEQTNLTAVADARTSAMLRAAFEKSAVQAASEWTFKPPTAGDAINDAYWMVRVPVFYGMRGQKLPSYGQWQSYIPGPRNPIPWLQKQLSNDDGVDMGTNGEVTQVGYGPTLKTPLQSS